MSGCVPWKSTLVNTCSPNCEFKLILRFSRLAKEVASILYPRSRFRRVDVFNRTMRLNCSFQPQLSARHASVSRLAMLREK